MNTSSDPLYPFQKDAIQRVAKGEQVYLGFDPGLGKSRAALEAALERKAKRVLVICQASGRYVWESEVKKWGGASVIMIKGIPDLKKLQGDEGIFVVTYGLLSQKDSPFAAVIAKGKPFDMCILDEAAAVKNSGANRTRAILGKMLPRLGYVLPLSGTPAPNHAGELFPILKALHPGALQTTVLPSHQMSQFEFEETFCVVSRKRFGNGQDVRVIEGSKNLPELRRRMNGFMIRVRKEEVLRELPPIRYDIVPLQVAPIPLPSVPQGLSDVEFMKYLSGATGDEHVMRLRRHLGLAKSIPAIEYIDDFLTNLSPSKKLLVFAHHTEVIERLYDNLQNWHPVQITGASSTGDRAKAINTFLTDRKCRLFIGNIQASGTGITLVGPSCWCSDVIFVEPSYSASDNVQAACRVHRIGQREAVVARFLTAHRTIDDRIQSILTRKAKDFANLFN